MRHWKQITTFVRVVERGSFSAAARDLKMTQPTVSKQVASLEAGLGVQLLLRTTRRVSPTKIGSRYFEACRRALAELSAAESDLLEAPGEPRGLLRAEVPMGFGMRRVVPRLPSFARRFAGIELELTFSDRFVDVLGEGLDVALRLGAVRDERLAFRKVGRMERVVVAAPSYLATKSAPRRPSDIARHACLPYLGLSSGLTWRFEGAGSKESVAVRGPLRADNGEALRTMCLAGFGIALLPDWMVEGDLAKGTLVALLPRWTPTGSDINVVFRQGRLSAKVEAFVSFAASVATTLRSRGSPLARG